MNRLSKIITILVLSNILISCGGKNKQSQIDYPQAKEEDLLSKKTIVGFNLPASSYSYLPTTTPHQYFILTKTGSHSYLKEHFKRIAPQYNQDFFDKHVCFVNKSYSDMDQLESNAYQCLERFQQELDLIGKNIDYILGPPSERGLLLTGKLRSKANIPQENGPDENELLPFIDKSTMKEVIANNPHENILSAKYIRLNSSDYLADKESFFTDFDKKCHQNLPSDTRKFIIKPSHGVASYGIQILKNIKSCEDLYKQFSEYLENSNVIKKDEIFLIEEFIEGKVYRYDSYIANGKIEQFFVSYYKVPPIDFYQKGTPTMYSKVEDKEELEELYDFAKTIMVDIFQVETSVFHLEAIRRKDGANKGRLYFLETAVRPGGGLQDALSSIGYNPMKAFIWQQIGLKIETKEIKESFDVVEVATPLYEARKKFKILQLSSANLDEFETLLPLKEDFRAVGSTIRTPGDWVGPGQKLGLLIFTGADADKVHKEAQKFYKSLRVKVRISDGPYYWRDAQLDKCEEGTDLKWTCPVQN